MIDTAEIVDFSFSIGSIELNAKLGAVNFAELVLNATGACRPRPEGEAQKKRSDLAKNLREKAPRISGVFLFQKASLQVPTACRARSALKYCSKQSESIAWSQAPQTGRACVEIVPSGIARRDHCPNPID